MKKILSLIVALTLLVCSLSVLTGCDDKKGNGDPEATKEYCEYLNTRDNNGKNIKYVRLKIKDMGDIVLALDATVAPITVANFVKLVDKGFYDGLTFHRVVEGFVIQGGDPNRDGTGGSNATIYGEFKENGYRKNDIEHIRGVISMARNSTSNNSASSQFFICVDDVRASLDGKYASFGYVIYGMSTVNKILEHGLKNIASGETVNAAAQTVIEKAEVISAESAYAYTKDYYDITKIPTPAPEEPEEEEKKPEIKVQEWCDYFLTRVNTDKAMSYVRLKIKDMGEIVLALDGTVAPVTVANFVKLVSEGFYDGITFHRVVKNFVIQGGDPRGDGYGGSEETIYGEFSANGYNANDIQHIRGVISMARSQEYDSASSQFFICLGDVRGSLDGRYAGFGYVIYGMSTVEKILEHGLKNLSSSEVIIKDKQPIIEKAEIITESEALEYTKDYEIPEN